MPGSQRAPIINGVPDTDPAHMAVVAISDDRVLCSATLITPKVVLTAAHCVDGRVIGDYEAFFGLSGREAERRRIAGGWVHPEFDINLLVYDIALLRLAGSPPAGVEPIPYLPDGLTLTRDDEGMQVQFVGFGRTEKGGLADKLTVFGELGWVCSSTDTCGGQGFPIKERAICFDESEGGICFGDSGGPNLIRRDNKEYVAGINSYVAGAFCYDISCSTKVDEFTDFIEAFIAAETKQGEPCSENEQCLTGFCADGVCCDFACQSPCEACDLPGSAGACTRVTDNATEPGCATDEGCATAGDPRGAGIALALLGLLWLLVRRR